MGLIFVTKLLLRGLKFTAVTGGAGVYRVPRSPPLYLKRNTIIRDVSLPFTCHGSSPAFSRSGSNPPPVLSHTTAQTDLTLGFRDGPFGGYVS